MENIKQNVLDKQAFENWIMKVLVEEYEHQYGVKCTYHEIIKDNNENKPA